MEGDKQCANGFMLACLQKPHMQTERALLPWEDLDVLLHDARALWIEQLFLKM